MAIHCTGLFLKSSFFYYLIKLLTCYKEARDKIHVDVGLCLVGKYAKEYRGWS